MGIYEELVARGLIAQVTNEEEIREMINKIKNDEEKEVLERHYIQSQSWEKIAERMGVSRITAIRIHGKALKNLKIPKDDTE